MGASRQAARASAYQRRYPEMPRPVVGHGTGQVQVVAALRGCWLATQSEPTGRRNGFVMGLSEHQGRASGRGRRNLVASGARNPPNLRVGYTKLSRHAGVRTDGPIGFPSGGQGARPPTRPATDERESMSANRSEIAAIVFTDLVGSTALRVRLGDDAFDAVRARPRRYPRRRGRPARRRGGKGRR